MLPYGNPTLLNILRGVLYSGLGDITTCSDLTVYGREMPQDVVRKSGICMLGQSLLGRLMHHLFAIHGNIDYNQLKNVFLKSIEDYPLVN